MKTHGFRTRQNCNAFEVKVYSCWRGLKQRCYNRNNRSFKNYGGRGIKVCKRWQGENGFTNFLHDVGFPPTIKHTLERINNNDGYKPSNCKWATKSEQSKNRRAYGKSGIKGIYQKKGKWEVSVRIGIFKTLVEAKIAYEKAIQKINA